MLSSFVTNPIYQPTSISTSNLDKILLYIVYMSFTQALLEN